jgi:hypothetical protein
LAAAEGVARGFGWTMGFKEAELEPDIGTTTNQTKLDNMRAGAFILGLFTLLIFGGCSAGQGQNVTATAIIRVMEGNSPQASTNDNYINTGISIFSSYDLAEHAGESLGLSKLWGMSDVDAAGKIFKSLSVRVGNDPGTIVVALNGIEHPVAVKILNDICTNAAGKQFSESLNGGKDEPVHISIVQPAK